MPACIMAKSAPTQTRGPAPNGSGNSASSNVNYAPFLTAPSPYCSVVVDVIFANGFD